MKFEIFKYSKVKSTNNIAISLIKNKKKEFGCVFAKTQTKGRGTKGKKWISKIGNLFTTIFFPLKKNYPPFHEFSIINPIIISKVIKKFCKKKISFKWPNDILIDDKKISGILQEVVTFNDKEFLIIGIGVNVISNPKIDNYNGATNILFESKMKPRINEMIKLLINEYEIFFSNLNKYNFIKYKNKLMQ